MQGVTGTYVEVEVANRKLMGVKKKTGKRRSFMKA